MHGEGRFVRPDVHGHAGSIEDAVVEVGELGASGGEVGGREFGDVDVRETELCDGGGGLAGAGADDEGTAGCRRVQRGEEAEADLGRDFAAVVGVELAVLKEGFDRAAAGIGASGDGDEAGGKILAEPDQA